MSPDVRRGYKEPGFEGDVDDVGGRRRDCGNLVFSVWGSVGETPGSALRGIIGRFDIPIYSGGAKWATAGAPRDARR